MNKINKSIRTGLVAVASLLACYSCSDTWDDHYKASSENANLVDATIYQYMKTQPELSDFIEVVDAAGYKAMLDETQIVTVFAPVNGTFDKQALIDGINSGSREIVLTRFIKNHIARYNYSSNEEEQNVELLNKKVTTMSNGYVSLDSIKTRKANIQCTNGILHIMESQIPFHANIYELMETTADMDSIYQLFVRYDEDSLDINRSVYRGVDEDGNRIYVDSVLIHTNDLMTRLRGYIHREDSDYTIIVPTNEALSARLEEARKYFVYNVHEEDRDSLQNFYANYYTLNPLMFNNNSNLHQDDSLVTTTYSKWDPKYNVFYKPFERGGILEPGTYNDRIECSNGVVYTTSQYPSSIYDSFFREIELECEHSGNVNNEQDKDGNALFTRTCSYSSVVINDNSVSNRSYLDVQPSNSSAQPYIGFNIPNTLAGTYDAYIVTVPLKMGRNVQDADTLKPYQFRVNLFTRTNRPTDVNATWPNSGVRLKNPKDNGNNFVSNPEQVDTIFLGEITFTECYYSVPQVGVMLQVQSYVSSSQTKTYSRRMLFDRIYLKPHGMPERGKEARNAELVDPEESVEEPDESAEEPKESTEEQE